MSKPPDGTEISSGPLLAAGRTGLEIDRIERELCTSPSISTSRARGDGGHSRRPREACRALGIGGFLVGEQDGTGSEASDQLNFVGAPVSTSRTYLERTLEPPFRMSGTSLQKCLTPFISLHIRSYIDPSNP
jgi:hypothetical protein